MGASYYELGVDADEDVALQILTDVQRRAQATQREETFTELYWFLLIAAAGLIGLSARSCSRNARSSGGSSRPAARWWCCC